MYKIYAYAYYDSLVDQCIAGDINNPYMMKEQNMTIKINALEN